MHPSPRTIAGHPASWSRILLEVSEEASGTLHAIPCDPIDLFTPSDAGRSIDARALLRESVIPDPPYWALVWTGARAIAAVAGSLELSPGT